MYPVPRYGGWPPARGLPSPRIEADTVVSTEAERADHSIRSNAAGTWFVADRPHQKGPGRRAVLDQDIVPAGFRAGGRPRVLLLGSATRLRRPGPR